MKVFRLPADFRVTAEAIRADGRAQGVSAEVTEAMVELWRMGKVEVGLNENGFFVFRRRGAT